MLSMFATVTLIFVTFFFFNHPATTEIYTLSLHDALPISPSIFSIDVEDWYHILEVDSAPEISRMWYQSRSEEHTSELQSLTNLVCRLLLEKKKKTAQLTHCTDRRVSEVYGCVRCTSAGVQ